LTYLIHGQIFFRVRYLGLSLSRTCGASLEVARNGQSGMYASCG